MKTAILIMIGLVATAGAKAGETRLTPCPDSPNCVSSLAEDERHFIRPLSFQGDDASAWKRLQSVLADMPRVELVTATDTYLHAKFRSALFRFVDDVEFELDAGNDRIDVRSASRVGYSDLGVNRKRVETIRRAFDSVRGTGYGPSAAR